MLPFTVLRLKWLIENKHSCNPCSEENWGTGKLIRVEKNIKDA